MRRVGLTGNIASGKSSVARLFAELGARVVDADVLAREAVAPGTTALAAIVARFGEDVLQPDGTLDRAALRGIVFRDAAARADLNAIVHPEVGRLRSERAAQAAAEGVTVLIDEIPLLFEAGLADQFDAIVFVDADESVRLARLMHDRGLPEADARAMMTAQADAAPKRARATWVIRNDGTREALVHQVHDVWRALLARDRPDPISPDGAPPVSNIPADLRYTKEHEYVKSTADDGVVLVGITDYAQGELGDIVYVDLPKPGARFNAHDVFGTVEAVKAVSELFMPVTGEVVEINAALDGEPALVNNDPYGGGWMIKVKLDAGGDAGLMSAAEYQALVG
ncbi:MAG: dephospho-CoA kinase [Gemmatimonadaceae bacterium]|jgi:dephospho-CoA kinase/glycine cleavage system H protein|nr:dephospho-CoA kinase [Gemmatimonadaceae bacterium]